MVIVLTNCIRTNSEWKSLIVDNSLEGWHIFKDVESTRGWIVENNIFIFNGVSDMESGEGDASLLSSMISKNKKSEVFVFDVNNKIRNLDIYE